jgi:group I intron endonuclease
MLSSALIEWRGIYVRADNQPLSRPGLYVFINLVNGKRYVGISQNVRRRLREHTIGNGCVPILSKAFRKYGNESFVAIPLLYSIDGTDHLPELEAEFIREFSSVSNGYNVQAASGAVGPYGEAFGAILKAAKSTPDAKARASEASKKHRNTDHAREAMSDENKRRYSDPEYKERQIALLREISQRPERNAKISAALKARPINKERVAKMKETRRGQLWITDGDSDKWLPKDTPIPEGWRKGRSNGHSFTQEAQRKATATRIGRIIITDGSVERRIYPTDPIPDGWRKGRSKPPSFCNPEFAKYASGARTGKRRK